MTTITLRKILTGSLIVSLLFLTGCATRKDAAFTDDTTNVDTSKESVAFFTLKISNKNNIAYQPYVHSLIVFEDKEKDNNRFSFAVEDPYKEVESQYNEYIVSFQVKPGKYILTDLIARGGWFPIMGVFSTPLSKSITIPDNKVIYLGHMDAKIIDKTKDDELRAGPLLPLVDQAIIGASTGTFKIKITDRYDQDIKLVQKKYSYLNDLPVENMTLSEWEQPVR
ncbi:hypothetical protein [Zooshikella sp. RANM57]|uniref:hypothetical protein n=1 Tax=Zooshikella sp. RANM57 TaxID=3425863 RepID=UPI003D6EC131